MNDTGNPEERDSIQWGWAGITGADIQERARWLAEKRTLHGNSLRFFELAGKILLSARTDYVLLPAVFFHAILGLERALKLHYEETEGYLKPLLQRAVADGLVDDSKFSAIRPFSPELKLSRNIRELPTHQGKLVEIIPEWRNEYFHGQFLLAPDFFHLTMQVREIADCLTTNKIR